MAKVKTTALSKNGFIEIYFDNSNDSSEKNDQHRYKVPVNITDTDANIFNYLPSELRECETSLRFISTIHALIKIFDDEFTTVFGILDGEYVELRVGYEILALRSKVKDHKIFNDFVENIEDAGYIIHNLEIPSHNSLGREVEVNQLIQCVSSCNCFEQLSRFITRCRQMKNIIKDIFERYPGEAKHFVSEKQYRKSQSVLKKIKLGRRYTTHDTKQMLDDIIDIINVCVKDTLYNIDPVESNESYVLGRITKYIKAILSRNSSPLLYQKLLEYKREYENLHGDMFPYADCFDSDRFKATQYPTSALNTKPQKSVPSLDQKQDFEMRQLSMLLQRLVWKVIFPERMWSLFEVSYIRMTPSFSECDTQNILLETNMPCAFEIQIMDDKAPVLINAYATHNVHPEDECIDIYNTVNYEPKDVPLLTLTTTDFKKL